MTVRDIYEKSVEIGKRFDPRGESGVAEYLRTLQAEYDSLPDNQKHTFDSERLWNPWGDTRIVTGPEDAEVRRVLVGIEIHGQEILLASELNRRGSEQSIDCIIGHHSTCLARSGANIQDIMVLQVPMMVEVGVPRHKAEKVVRKDIESKSLPENYQNAAIAEILRIPVVGIHTPTDNYGMHFTRQLVAEEKPQTVGDFTELLKTIPECEVAVRRRTSRAPEILTGSASDILGTIYYCLTGGWNPSPAAFRLIAEAGVGTCVMVDASEEHKKIADEFNMSIVKFPHFPADSLGINLLLDKLQQESPFEVVPCSNFTRIERSQSHG